jgi:hypothetical protein
VHSSTLDASVANGVVNNQIIEEGLSMPSMGKYCKAYYEEQLAQYPHWAEMANVSAAGNAAIEDASAQPGSPNYFFLQENFVVTRGIYKDQDIVFDVITAEWKDFCEKTLCFEVPTDEEPAPASDK